MEAKPKLTFEERAILMNEKLKDPILINRTAMAITGFAFFIITTSFIATAIWFYNSKSFDAFVLLCVTSYLMYAQIKSIIVKHKENKTWKEILIRK